MLTGYICGVGDVYLLGSQIHHPAPPSNSDIGAFLGCLMIGVIFVGIPWLGFVVLDELGLSLGTRHRRISSKMNGRPYPNLPVIRRSLNAIYSKLTAERVALLQAECHN